MRSACDRWRADAIVTGCRIGYDLATTDIQQKGGAMAAGGYTRAKLTEVKDSAPGFGFEEHQQAHFATGDLGALDTGISYHRVKPGMRQGFAHKHDRAEEVYVVVAGSGRMKLDDEVIELEPLDAIRVAPTTIRQ